MVRKTSSLCMFYFFPNISTLVRTTPRKFSGVDYFLFFLRFFTDFLFFKNLSPTAVSLEYPYRSTILFPQIDLFFSDFFEYANFAFSKGLFVRMDYFDFFFSE